MLAEKKDNNLEKTSKLKPENLIEKFKGECLLHMASNGIPFDGQLITDGKLYRFSRDNKKNQVDEYYICNTDTLGNGRSYLWCIYGTWEGGKTQFLYKSYEKEIFSKEEWARIKKHEEEWNKKRKEEQRLDREKRLKRAQKIWQEASDIISPVHSTYLEKKKVKSYQIRYGFDHEKNPVLVIPIRNSNGEIQGIQYIPPDGVEKKIHGLKKGNFHLLGEIKDTSTIFITEGYATGASVHEATNNPVVIAFDCGNLNSVISNITTKYPKHEIIIAADDDSEKEGNPGKKHAEEAAKKYKCSFVLPKFPAGHKLPNGDNPSDFNDLHVEFGIEEVKKQLEKVLPKISLSVEKPIRFWEEEGLTYQKFPVEVLPPILKHAAQEVSRSVKVPIEMSSGAILSATATSFHNNVLVIEKNHLEHFITFFIMIVGESSERKSKTFDRAVAPLIKYTSEREKEYQQGYFSYKGMKRVIDKQINEITSKIKGESPEEFRNKCASDIIILEQKLKLYEPPPFKFFTTDSTEPAFVRCLEKNNGCFSLLSSEGGDILDYISGTKNSNNKTNDSVFLKVITGDPIGRERIGDKGHGESIYIPKPCGNILVMIQPNRFYEFMSNPVLRNCGLISRISPVLAHENSMVGKRIELDEKGELKPDDDADMQEYEHLLLPFLRNKKQIRVGLSKRAALARAQFHDSIERQLGIGGELRDIADIAGKATSFATKLAALFHLSKNFSGLNAEMNLIHTEMSDETFNEAAIMQKYFLGQAANTQRTTERQAKLNKAREVLYWIIDKTKKRDLDVFTYADIYNNYGKRPKLKCPETKQLVQLFVNTGWVSPVSGEKDRFRLRKSQETEGY